MHKNQNIFWCTPLLSTISHNVVLVTLLVIGYLFPKIICINMNLRIKQFIKLLKLGVVFILPTFLFLTQIIFLPYYPNGLLIRRENLETFFRLWITIHLLNQACVRIRARVQCCLGRQNFTSSLGDIEIVSYYLYIFGFYSLFIN